MSPNIEKLFNKNRLDGSVAQLLLLTLYAPFGVLLLLVRIFISLQLILAVTVLPRGATITRLVVRCLCGVLGLFVRQQNQHSNPLYWEDESTTQGGDESGSAIGKQRLVVVANHVTAFDHFALTTVMPCLKVRCNGEGLPWPLSALLDCQQLILQPLPAQQSHQHQPQPPPRRDETFKKKLSAFLTSNTTNATSNGGTNATNEAAVASNSSSAASNSIDPNLPLLLFPEDATTNGSSALLKYQGWAGSVVRDGRVCVVCISVHRVPLLPLAPSVLVSNFAHDLLALLFCPLTVYTVKYLGMTVRAAGESDGDLCRRLQLMTSQELDVHASQYDVTEKYEHIKRCVTAQQQQQQQHQSTSLWAHLTAGGADQVSGEQAQRLARQVQEVLPHLPYSAILQDIVRTGNVDVTITNFLEGTTVVMPHQHHEPPPHTTQHSNSAILRGSSTSSATTTKNSTTTSLNTNNTATRSSVFSSINAASASTVFSSSSSINAASDNSNLRSIPPVLNTGSFSDRKKALIEFALAEYVRKCGIRGETDPYMKISRTGGSGGGSTNITPASGGSTNTGSGGVSKSTTISAGSTNTSGSAVGSGTISAASISNSSSSTAGGSTTAASSVSNS